MASALTSFVATRPAAFTTQQQRSAARSGRRLQRCYAATEEEKLDFNSNKRSALGFTESDSAGQSNVFAVEPKSYVAGSSADATSEGAKVTFVVGLAAAVVAFAACAAFLLADTKPSSIADLAPAADAKTLTAYSQQFAAETSPALSE